MVVAQAGIQDQRVPLVFQLDEGIVAVLPSLATFLQTGHLGRGTGEIINDLVTHIFESEVAILCAERDGPFVWPLFDVCVVAFHFGTVTVVLTIDVSAHAGIFLEEIEKVLWQIKGCSELRQIAVVDDLIVSQVGIIIGQ